MFSTVWIIFMIINLQYLTVISIFIIDPIWNISFLGTEFQHVCSPTALQLSFFFSGRSPGYRLPWSQVLGEKVSLLPVGHTRRVPYLLFANLISIFKIPRLLPYTDTQHPKNPGRCGPVIFSIQLRFWGCSPRTRPGRTSDLGRQNANV